MNTAMAHDTFRPDRRRFSQDIGGLTRQAPDETKHPGVPRRRSGFLFPGGRLHRHLKENPGHHDRGTSDQKTKPPRQPEMN